MSGKARTGRDRPLAGRRALVCGASRGIGRACAVELARLGAQVCVSARDAEALEAVRRALASPGRGRHLALAADFDDPGAVERLAGALLAAWPRVHLLVNNSGGPPGGPLLEAPPEELLAAMRRHLAASHLLARALVPGMKADRYGRIINILSTSVRAPILGLGVSNSTRAAMANWARTLAAETAAFGVTVNSVLPGSTDTERLRALLEARAKRAGTSLAEARRRLLAGIPAGRLGRPEEIAYAVGFLARPEAAFITGIALPVDGGKLSAAGL